MALTPLALELNSGAAAVGLGAQRVRGSLRIDRGRRTGIAQVVPYDVAPAARGRLAERVGPGHHCRAAREQNERRLSITEGLDPKRDSVSLDGRHHASAVEMTRPDVRNEWIIGYMVKLQWRRDGGTSYASPSVV